MGSKISTSSPFSFIIILEENSPFAIEIFACSNRSLSWLNYAYSSSVQFSGLSISRYLAQVLLVLENSS